jgi:hypothetical protein
LVDDAPLELLRDLAALLRDLVAPPREDELLRLEPLRDEADRELPDRVLFARVPPELFDRDPPDRELADRELPDRDPEPPERDDDPVPRPPREPLDVSAISLSSFVSTGIDTRR